MKLKISLFEMLTCWLFSVGLPPFHLSSMVGICVTIHGAFYSLTAFPEPHEYFVRAPRCCNFYSECEQHSEYVMRLG